MNPIILNPSGFSHAFTLVLAVGLAVVETSDEAFNEEYKIVAGDEDDTAVSEEVSDEECDESAGGVGKVGEVGGSGDIGGSGSSGSLGCTGPSSSVLAS